MVKSATVAGVSVETIRTWSGRGQVNLTAGSSRSCTNISAIKFSFAAYDSRGRVPCGYIMPRKVSLRVDERRQGPI